MHLLCTSLLATFALQTASAFPNFESSASSRTTNSLLLDHPAFPPLPHPELAANLSASVGLNLSDIQGDILIGMKKKAELFYLFTIENPAKFKSQLASGILPLLTSTQQLLNPNTTIAVNIAFSQKGLNTLGVQEHLGDDLFAAGQFTGAEDLGDELNKWKPAFTGNNHIHGIFLIAAGTIADVNSTLSQIQKIMDKSISEVFRVQAQVRPGDQAGHEHFGFLDGMSNPTVKGFNTPVPGQALLDPGVILVNEPGDTVPRPAWTKGGAFLVFRQLQQFVPEFNKFLVDNAPPQSDMTADESAQFFGARVMGRWKSGAPIDLTSRADDPVLAADPQRNNDFDFNHTDPGFDLRTNQSFCPFASHIRKTNPRADLGGTSTFNNHFIRSGIAYGPEVTDAETASNTTSSDPSLERGLAFAAYQANITQGFAFLQKSFANDIHFLHETTGFDLVVGQQNGKSRSAAGFNLANPNQKYSAETQFIVNRGGEYFFSPPISGIKNRIAV
jgi:Dyp-type peroxidase family